MKLEIRFFGGRNQVSLDGERLGEFCPSGAKLYFGGRSCKKEIKFHNTEPKGKYFKVKLDNSGPIPWPVWERWERGDITDTDSFYGEVSGNLLNTVLRGKEEVFVTIHPWKKK
jgi:hypothetical protein